MPGEQVGEAEDHVAKPDGARAGASTDEQRKHRQRS
jgi:hypothetical protein